MRGPGERIGLGGSIDPVDLQGFLDDVRRHLLSQDETKRPVSLNAQGIGISLKETD